MAKLIDEVTDEYWNNSIDEENRFLIEDYLSQQSHLSSATLKQYKSALRIFARWVQEVNMPKGKKIYELKPRDALRYQNWLVRDIGLSSSGVKFKRSAVSSLCGYIEVFYEDDYKDFRNIFTKSVPNVIKSAKKEKLPLTTKEINTLIKELEKRGEWQKLAYLQYTYVTGCRREESRQLLKEVVKYNKYIDKQGNEKKYYLTHTIRAKGKGEEGKPRKFKIDDNAMEALKKWIEYRATLVDIDDCDYVFVSKTKDGYRQLSANTFNLWCEYFSKILGGRPVHPHLFRSSRATNIIVEDGGDIKAVQSLLGHASSQTTEIYVVRDESDLDDDLF